MSTGKKLIGDKRTESFTKLNRVISVELFRNRTKKLEVEWTDSNNSPDRSSRGIGGRATTFGK